MAREKIPLGFVNIALDLKCSGFSRKIIVVSCVVVVLWQFKHILEINTQEQSTEEYRCKSGINLCLSLFKGTESVILSDSSCRDVNARYTTVYNIYP